MGYKIRGNRIYVTGTVDGTHYRLSTGKEATPANIAWIKKNHRDVLLKLIDKDKPKPSTMFADYAKKSVHTSAYTVKQSTQYSYERMLHRHIIPYFKHYKLEDIKASDIRAFQSKLLESMDARSAKNVRILLGKILNDAVIDEIIDKNHVKLVKPPKHISTKEIEPFTLDEVQTLIYNAKPMMRTFLTVAFFTGMRTGEMLALRWDDIDFNTNKIHVRRSMRQGVESTTKSGKSRVIDMLDPVRHALEEKFRDNGLKGGYIFTTRKGTPYKESSSITETHWRPLLRRCGIPHRVLYNTRHTFATTMLKNGEDILWVSTMLGHANVSTTMKYYIKYVEQKGQKRAKFLDDIFAKNRTLSAQFEAGTEKHA